MRFSPSRQYLWAGLVALVLAGVSGWFAMEWPFAIVAVVLFVLSAAAVLWLALCPVVEIQDKQLLIGKRSIFWSDIRRLDRTGWVSPLVVYLTLADSSRILLVYAGDLDASNNLLRQLRRQSREALIDGIPWRKFWGDALPPAPERKQITGRKYQLLRQEDEAEVERLYQLLKTVGHIDPKNSSDEK